MPKYINSSCSSITKTKYINQSKNEWKISIDISPKKTYRKPKKHMKRYSTSLIITEMQNQSYNEVSPNISWNGHHQQAEASSINAGEGVEKRKPSYPVGGNVNWYNYYHKQYGGILKN